MFLYDPSMNYEEEDEEGGAAFVREKAQENPVSLAFVLRQAIECEKHFVLKQRQQLEVGKFQQTAIYF